MRDNLQMLLDDILYNNIGIDENNFSIEINYNNFTDNLFELIIRNSNGFATTCIADRKIINCINEFKKSI